MLRWLIGFFLATLVTIASAATGPALIVLPSIGDVEANLTTKLTNAGYTVTTSTGVPAGSLSTYKQIWDVRYDTALSPTEINSYKDYLQAGGSLFLLGEAAMNPYLARDITFVDLAVAAGAGAINTGNFASALGTQTISAPFNANPNAISSVEYMASAGLPSTGLGTATAITVDTNGLATAIAWAPGSMSAAPNGTIIAVFDVNPLIGFSFRPEFIENLIAYLAAPGGGAVSTTAIPTLSEWAMIFMASLMALFGIRRMRRNK
jgi:hypothetical protein